MDISKKKILLLAFAGLCSGVVLAEPAPQQHVPSTGTVSGDTLNSRVDRPKETEGTVLVGTVLVISDREITLVNRDGGAATFQINKLTPVDGGPASIAELPLNTKVKIWADPSGHVSRASIDPEYVDKYF